MASLTPSTVSLNSESKHPSDLGAGPTPIGAPATSRPIPYISGRLVACYLANMIGLGGVAIPFLFMYCGRIFSCVLLCGTGAVTAFVLHQQTKVMELFPTPSDTNLESGSGSASGSDGGSNSASSDTPPSSVGAMKANHEAPLLLERREFKPLLQNPSMASISPPSSDCSVEAGGWSFNLLAAKGLHRYAAVALDLSVTASIVLVTAYFLKVVVQCLISAGVQLHNGDYQANGGWAASTEFLTVCVGCVTSLLSLRPRMLDHHVFSVVAAASIVGILGVLLIIIFVDGVTDDPAPLWINWESPEKIFQCLPIFIAAFSVAYNSPTIIAEVLRRWQAEQLLAEGPHSVVVGAESTPTLLIGLPQLHPPKEYWQMIRRSIYASVALVAIINSGAGLLGTAAVSSAALTKGGGNLLSSLPMTHVNQGGAVCVLIIILRFLVAVHVCTVFPVYATTGRQALLRVIYPRGKYLKLLQWILTITYTVSAILLSLHSPTVALLIGLNCAIFAPSISLAVPVLTAYRLRTLAGRLGLEQGNLRPILVGVLLIALYGLLCTVSALYFWVKSVA
jgi:hypothetical protein